MTKVQEIRGSALENQDSKLPSAREDGPTVLRALAKARQAAATQGEATQGGSLREESASDTSNETHPIPLQGWDENWLIGEAGFVKPYIPPHLLAHYEQIKIAFLARYADSNLKSLLLVATDPGHGTSTSAYYLACALAKDPSIRVLLIDANINRGSRRHAFSESPFSRSGMIAREDYPIIPTQSETQNLQFARSLATDRHSLPLLQSAGLTRFLADAKQQFHYVIIDAPPIQKSPESLWLCAQVDGVILVVESERTRKKLAAWTKRRIEAVGGKLIGVVLNKKKYHVPTWLYNRL